MVSPYTAGSNGPNHSLWIVAARLITGSVTGAPPTVLVMSSVTVVAAAVELMICSMTRPSLTKELPPPDTLATVPAGSWTVLLLTGRTQFVMVRGVTAISDAPQRHGAGRRGQQGQCPQSRTAGRGRHQRQGPGSRQCRRG